MGQRPRLLIPDEFLARNVARQTSVKIVAWQGRCEVHERFTAEDILELRAAYPNAEVLAHPECPTEVIEVSHFTGSTAAMTDYVAKHKPKQVVLITECSMADNVACEAPETEFIRPCNLCPHMKMITLQNIYDALVQRPLRGDRRPRRGRPRPRFGATHDRHAAARRPRPLRPREGPPPRGRGADLMDRRYFDGVLIVGAGLAGLSAALSAAEAGRKVLVY